MRIFLNKSIFKLTLTAALVLSTNAALASGFGLFEESVSMMGNEYAGAGAAGVDASNEYYNAAQASLFKKAHVSIGAVAIPVEVTFNGDLMSKAVGLEPQKQATVKNLKSTKWGFVPSFHLVAPLTNSLSFAFGITAPFGLESDYDAAKWVDTGAGAGALGVPTNTAIMGINFNPSFSYKLNSSLAIAAGLDIMYASAKYDASADFTGADSVANDLTGWGVGYNVGLLYSLSNSARIGLSYRSSIAVDAVGYSEIKSESSINKATADLDLPGNILLSGFYRISQHWDGLASVQYTTWSVLKNLKIEGVLNPLLPGNTMVIDSNLNYKNTWFFALGTNYHLNKQWSFSLGAGYDQTPTRDGYRDLRLPGSDRYVAAIGAHWNPYPFMKVDLAYQHIFTGKAKVDSSKRSDVKSPAMAAFYAVGTAQMDINLIGVGVNFTF